jgi:hypothetical protein
MFDLWPMHFISYLKNTAFYSAVSVLAIVCYAAGLYRRYQTGAHRNIHAVQTVLRSDARILDEDEQMLRAHGFLKEDGLKFAYNTGAVPDLPTRAFSQGIGELSWKTLKDVTFESRWNEKDKTHYQYPRFGPKVRAEAGKELIITGYIIPLDTKGELYAVSANPFASCYFCGKSGPESVVQLHFSKTTRRYKVDEILDIKGTLRLNADDPTNFIYQFDNAEEYE